MDMIDIKKIENSMFSDELRAYSLGILTTSEAYCSMKDKLSEIATSGHITPQEYVAFSNLFTKWRNNPDGQI